MTPAKQTLAEIDALLESQQESSFRGHLGASVLGGACVRELWYNFRWAIQEKHCGQLLRLFARGNLEEARFFEYLRSIGCTVWEYDERTKDKSGKPRQFRVSFLNGHGGGSLDAVARGLREVGETTIFTVSAKTHNEKSFNKLVETGVISSKFEHFVQEQLYMHHMGIYLNLYMGVCKNDDRLHLEWLKYDKQVAERALERGGEVIYSNIPPKRAGKTPGDFVCKFCHNNRLCHFGDVPVAMNCRTCRFSRVIDNGGWYCGIRSALLTEAEQRAGCGSYQVRTDLQGVQP